MLAGESIVVAFIQTLCARSRLLLTGLLLVGCGSLQAQDKGTLNLLVNPEPPTLVAIANTADPTIKVSSKIHEGLLAYDGQLNPKPSLAVAWSISDDGLVYLFTLRQGVTWHDGKPFTAEDVVFSLQTLQQQHPRGRNTFSTVTGIDSPRADQVRLRLSQPAPYLIKAFSAAESPIIPRHLYAGQDVASHPANSAPVGTGPFMFDHWARGQYVVLKRNPNYWDTGKPKLDKLVIKFLPDPAARVAAFESGSLDIGGQNPVPLSEIARLRKNPRLQIRQGNDQASAAQTLLEFNLDNAYLKDLRVRQAIAHAINREVIKNTVWYGYAQVSPTPIASGTLYHDATPSPYNYDLAVANRLLDEAGWPRKGDGRRFALTIDYLPVGEGSRREAEYLKAALSRIGIALTLRSQDFSAYAKRIYTDRDFDLTTTLMGNGFDPVIGVQRLYWSKNFKPGVPFSNGSHYANPRVDSLLEQAAVERDETRRKALYREFQQIVAQELPNISLIRSLRLSVVNQRVHDLDQDADDGGLNGNFAGVWVE